MSKSQGGEDSRDWGHPRGSAGLEQGVRRGVTEGKADRQAGTGPEQECAEWRGRAGPLDVDVTEASEAKKRHGQAHTLGPEAHSRPPLLWFPQQENEDNAGSQQAGTI